MNLSSRLDRLERFTPGETIFIRMQPGDAEEQAKARWLAGHPDLIAGPEQAGARVRFVRRVIVDPLPVVHSNGDQP